MLCRTHNRLMPEYWCELQSPLVRDVKHYVKFQNTIYKEIFPNSKFTRFTYCPCSMAEWLEHLAEYM